MKFLLCVNKGTGSEKGLPDPDIGIIYKSEHLIKGETCLYGGRSSNFWYTLSGFDKHYKFSSLLFEELPENFLVNITKNHDKIIKENIQLNSFLKT